MNGIDLPVVVYSDLEKFSDTISRARVRIFYKGLNRNSTYISEEFAEKLINTLPYAPIKGIYESPDFGDHGEARNEGKIYGIVPQDLNFKWEKHLDADGVEREYACCDVLLYTAIYEEASKIKGKSQSMEIYGPTIKGEWVKIDGQKVFEFKEGSFLGLQVLGDSVEPCFEGAAFFSKYKSIDDIYAKLAQYKSVLEGGNGGMDQKLNFNLSDREKFDILWQKINGNYNKENEWRIDYSIVDVYDNYAILLEYETHKYFAQDYSKNEETNEVELGERREVFPVFLTESQKAILKEYNEDLIAYFDKFTELENQVNELTDNLNSKVEEFKTLEEKHNEVTTAAQEYIKTTEELKATLEATIEENNSLKEFRHNVELGAKRALVESYSEKLSEEVIGTYTNEKLDSMTQDELEKELCYNVVKTNPTIFEEKEQHYIPQIQELTGINAILAKYKK